MRPYTGTAARTSTRILEIISPAGFERYFEELSEALTGNAQPDPGQISEIAARYGPEFDVDSVPGLVQAHGLRFGSDSG